MKKRKYRAFLWLLPVLFVLIIDIIILAYVFHLEVSGIPAGEVGHPSGLLTCFIFVVLSIPTVIIFIIFLIITIKRYDKLSKLDMEEQNESAELRTLDQK